MPTSASSTDVSGTESGINEPVGVRSGCARNHTDAPSRTPGHVDARDLRGGERLG
jgi:hypothetical protein